MKPILQPKVCPRSRAAFAWIALTTAATTLVHGQAVPPAPATPADAASSRANVVVPAAGATDETVELSPFVVQGEQGWNATETLAGTRLKTDLKDVPSQIEVFTKDFMDDLAINNVDEMVRYSVNADSLDDYFQDNNAENGAMNMTKKIRVRGLAQASLSRGFFASNFRSDNYNVDSTTIASGANPILFGLGNSAGVIDASVRRAGMSDRARLKLQFTSEDSHRGELHVNRVIVPNKVALSLDVLRAKTETYRKPNHDDEKRFTLSTTIRPFRNTTLRVSHENIDRDGNLAPPNAAQDRVSLWTLAPSVPGSPYTTERPGYDNRANIPGNISNTSRIFTTHSGNNALLSFGGTAIAPMNWGRSVTLLNPTAPTAFGVPNTQFDSSAYQERTFLDETYFPHDVNIVGDLRRTLQYGHITTVHLEQRLRRDLFLELAYNHEKFTQDKPMNLSNVKVFVDPNLYLPVALPGETTQRSNPNYGMEYLEFSTDGHWTRNLSENMRATLSYELNADKDLKFKGARWLGQHRLSGMFERGETHEVDQSGGLQARILDDPFIPGLTLTPRTTRDWARNNSRTPLLRAYFDPGYTAMAPIRDGRGWTYLDARGNPAQVTYGLDSGLVSAESGKRLGTSNAAPDTTARKIDSLIFGWQGSFLPDRGGRRRLVLTYGHRRDKIRVADGDAASRTRDFSGLFPAPDQVTWTPYGEADVTTNSNKGIMVHPFRWFSAFYSKSTTFAPMGRSQFDPYGNPYPGTGGEEELYGVQFFLPDNRLSLRISQYENTAGPTNAPTGPLRYYVRDARTLEQRVIDLDPTLPRINVTDGTMKGFPGGTSGYMVVSNRKSDGYEVQLTARPTTNWNVVFNAAQSKAVDSDIGVEWRQWIAERLPVWQTLVAKNGEVDASGRPVTWSTALLDPANPNETLKQFYDNTLIGTTSAFIEASQGKRTDGGRDRRANVVTSYRFSEGRLRGFSVNGAVRWLPAPAIGYPVKTLANGTQVLDVDRPFRGEEAFNIDLGVIYRGKMPFFRGLRYTAQLNVKNAFNAGGDTSPARAYTDGSVASIRINEPRLFIFSWTAEL